MTIVAAIVVETLLQSVLPPVAARPERPAVFVHYATGFVVAATAVHSRPGSDDRLAWLSEGLPVDIGGRASVAAGLRRADVLWIVARPPGVEPVYGFVPEAAVHLIAGHAPLLALDGVSSASLLAPVSGVTVAPGVAAGGDDVNGEARTALEAGASVAMAAPTPGPSPKTAGGGEKSGSPNQLDGAGAVAIPWLPDTVRRWWPDIAAAAERHGIDPELVALVALVESGGNPAAVSPAGARGLMQVMPATAADIASRRGLAVPTTVQLLDGATSLDFGAWYLAEQLRMFGGGGAGGNQGVALAAAAYNGGPGTVRRHLDGAALPAETTYYQRWVGGMWQERAAERSGTFEAWWAAGGRRLVEAAERG